MDTFKLENRYVVIKRNALTPGQFRALAEFIDSHGITELGADEGLVIEHDWPEYEPALAALAARIDGAERPLEIPSGPHAASPLRAMPEPPQGNFAVGAYVRFCGVIHESQLTAPEVGTLGIVLEDSVCPWVAFEGFDGLLLSELGHFKADCYCALTAELEAA